MTHPARRKPPLLYGIAAGALHERADFEMESSFKGHRVDALVLTGDEGRAKLR
jgi:hypothetical protein